MLGYGGLKTQLVHRQSSVTVTVSGRLDLTSAPALEEELERLIDGGARRVALDVHPLEYLSSAGLRAILVTAKRLRESGGTLAVVGLAGPVKEVFDMAGLSGVLETYPTEADLLAARPDW